MPEGWAWGCGKVLWGQLISLLPHVPSTLWHTGMGRKQHPEWIFGADTVLGALSHLLLWQILGPGARGASWPRRRRAACPGERVALWPDDMGRTAQAGRRHDA